MADYAQLNTNLAICYSKSMLKYQTGFFVRLSVWGITTSHIYFQIYIQNDEVNKFIHVKSNVQIK
jgi:hypothetical protein